MRAGFIAIMLVIITLTFAFFSYNAYGQIAGAGGVVLDISTNGKQIEIRDVKLQNKMNED